MSHAAGDEVWLAWVSTQRVNGIEVESIVSKATVAAVVEGRILFRRADTFREKYEFETICETEAEAWAVCAREIAAIRDRVGVAADNAAARAASCRVGEAVAS
jgi:hypothetical protein